MYIFTANELEHLYSSRMDSLQILSDTSERRWTPQLVQHVATSLPPALGRPQHVAPAACEGTGGQQTPLPI